jgi:hypothetical protein
MHDEAIVRLGDTPLGRAVCTGTRRGMIERAMGDKTLAVLVTIAFSLVGVLGDYFLDDGTTDCN